MLWKNFGNISLSLKTSAPGYIRGYRISELYGGWSWGQISRIHPTGSIMWLISCAKYFASHYKFDSKLSSTYKSHDKCLWDEPWVSDPKTTPTTWQRYLYQPRKIKKYWWKKHRLFYILCVILGSMKIKCCILLFDC